MSKRIYQKGRRFCRHDWSRRRRVLDERILKGRYHAVMVDTKVCFKCDRHIEKGYVVY